MGRYVFQPMEYKEYLKNYINTLKTGELLVNLEDHDIYVTEEGINIPIPIIGPLRNDIINYLENDLEGIKLQLSLTPERINNLFKIKSEIEEIHQNIYGRLMDLDAKERDLNSRSVYVNTINSYNVNQLGDLNIIIDNANEIDSTIEEMQRLINLFNYYNEDCRSIYSDDFSNRNNELIYIWGKIQELFNYANKKLEKLNNFSGSMTLQKKTTKNMILYDVEWNRKLWIFSQSKRGQLGSESEYLSWINSTDSNFGKWLRGNYTLDSANEPWRMTNRGGSNILYPGFARKKDTNFSDYGNFGDSYFGDKPYYLYHARRFRAFDLLEGPAFKNISKYSDFGTSTTNQIKYIRSAPNRIIPFYYGAINSLTKRNGYEDLLSNPTDSFAIWCHGNATINQNVYWGGGSAYWRQNVSSLYNKQYYFDTNYIQNTLTTQPSNKNFSYSYNGRNINFAPNQLIPKQGIGVKKSGNSYIINNPNSSYGFSDSDGSVKSLYLPTFNFPASNDGITYNEFRSENPNTDGIIFRMGLVKNFNVTVFSGTMNFNYNNDKGWVKN